METKSLMDHRIDKILIALEAAVPKIQDHENRINHLENNMILERRKCLNIKRKVESHVSQLLGGKESEIYKTEYRSTIRHLWHDYWNAFGITSYLDTPAMMYDQALKFIEDWRPHSLRGLEEPAARGA